MINLKCINCGAALEITPDMDVFACGYCGASQMVERRGGTVALKRVTDAISRVQVGTDKTAAELALNRLSGEWDQFIRYRAHRLYQIENESGTYLIGAFLCGGIGLSIALVSFLVGAMAEFIAVGFIACVLFAFLGIFLAVKIYSKGKEAAAAVIAEETEKLNQPEAVLRQKIEQNRAIANS